MDKNLFTQWQSVVPTLGNILQRIDEKTTIAVGTLPYRRIIPALFLRNYHIYSVRDTADADVLKKYVPITVLETHAPKIAARVQATSYLLGNYVFQGFLKSRRYPFRLLLNQTTDRIIQILTEKKWEWIGNMPESFKPVHTKAGFRDVIKQLGLPGIQDVRFDRESFLNKTFTELSRELNGSFVVQRADLEVGGMQGTFFIHTQGDWDYMHATLAEDTRFTSVQVTSFIRGNSVSMLGCVTHMGILTSPLQLQLIDVPEVLHGTPATGTFMGHDWGYTNWSKKTEQTAQHVVESVGSFLAARGYKGIFGIDFMHDPASDSLFPLECNPRPTGALPVYSLMVIQGGQVPPMEFFHFMTHLGIHEFFDFDAVNRELKRRLPVTHISLSPLGIYEMKLPIRAGVYEYNLAKKKLRYARDDVFPWDLKNSEEFLMIDAIPRKGAKISQNVPQLFKLIFNRSIATSSNSVENEVGQLITALVKGLRKDQVEPVTPAEGNAGFVE